jgi:murein L,D-transpeptidase YcbB/YkuD
MKTQTGKTLRLGMMGLSLAVTLLMTFDAIAQSDPTQDAIRKRIELIRRDGRLQVDTDGISAIKLIPDYYQAHNYRRAWTNPANADDLFRVIEDLQKDGLSPRDYHRDALLRLKGRIEASRAPDPEVLADYDLLLMDAMLRMVYHMLVGKVDPERLDPNWNLSHDIQTVDPVAAIREALNSEALYEFLERTKPTEPYYVRLKKALAEYRTIQETGGWKAIPEGPALKPGMTDRRVPLIRERLAATGDLAATEDRTSEMYDTELEEAVERFQNRHRISDDGVIGKGTLAEMNVPVASRIEQIRVNLERGRWVLHEMDPEYVLVNIAGFHTAHVRDGAFDFLARVQVGKPYRKTPVFKAQMKYLVFNPTWTVPPTILRKDVLPAIKRDPSYLKRKNMNVLTHSGKVVDPGTIDWSKYSGSNFPYIIRQGPGPTNALGLVKFIFPNEHFVFLHDTPSKSLFDRETRTFSSGCIRVENPFELAERLLDDPQKWNCTEIDKVIRAKETKTVYLNRPMPVLILYWTAYVDEYGQVNFIRDIYDFKVRERDIKGN